MTVLKTSLRNFFAHKGRMALSAVAVLLSVAFVCGTLVFTDTMNTTFDKLFAATSSDVTVSPKGAADGDDDARRTAGRRVAAGLRRRARCGGATGVKSAEGAVVSHARHRRRRRQQEHGLHHRRPDHRRQLERQRARVR